MDISLTEDRSARLNDLAQLADACREAFLTLAESHWQPAPDSAAALAQVALAKKDPATSSDGILAGFDLVSEVVVTYLEVAANHFGGLATLYRNGEVMFPPLPLVRSILEYCAHAVWVLGDSPGPAEDILARAYLEEFTSCEFAKMAAGRMGSKEDDSYKQAQKRWTEVRRRAIAAFPGTTPMDLDENKPGRTISNQTLPGPEKAVTWMLDLVYKKANGSVTKRQAEGLYAFLSSGTHPSLYQARQLRKFVDQGEYHGTVLTVDVSYLEKLLAGGVITFYNAFSYTTSYYGLPPAAHATLTAKIEAVLPGSLT